MTFKEIWNQLLRKQPSLQKPETVVEFRSDNLERLLLQVYEQGQKSVKPVEKPSGSAWNHVLSGMFR
jgi:hypothetical protein